MTAQQRTLQFESPSFYERLKSMLGVDFYHLFHTPMFYIFLAIAAIIPAMVLSMTGMNADGAAAPMYTNTWQMIAPLDAGVMNVISCLAGGILFSLGVDMVSRQVLRKSDLV